LASRIRVALLVETITFHQSCSAVQDGEALLNKMQLLHPLKRGAAMSILYVFVQHTLHSAASLMVPSRMEFACRKHTKRSEYSSQSAGFEMSSSSNEPPVGGCRLICLRVRASSSAVALCLFFHALSSRLLVNILMAHFHTYYSSPRQSPLSLPKDMSHSSPLQYKEGFHRRGNWGSDLSGHEGLSPGTTHGSRRRRLGTGRDGRFYCRSSASASAKPAMSNAAVQQ
ncbi:hypothetical protein T4C_2600, partial [Trichinella pseudospiralis]